MSWKDRLKPSKKFKKAAKFVATGGLMPSELSTAKALGDDGFGGSIDDLTGVSAANKAQQKALKSLSGRIGQGQQLSNQTMQDQLGVLGGTYDDQRAQYESALAQAQQGDSSALEAYQQQMMASQGQIADLLGPQAALQGQYLPEVTQSQGERLANLRGSDQYNELYGERASAAAQGLADAGLRRSSAAGETFGDLSMQTLMDLDNQNYGRQLGLLNMGNQGTNNLANFYNNSNMNMANTGLNQNNMMTNRAYQGGMGIADLIGNRGQNEINLRGTNAANQMNLLGQLGQAQSAAQIAQGQNTMNARLGLLGGLSSLGGAFLGGIG